MISYINTSEVERIATEMSKRINTLDGYFNSLFKRLENVPDVTREWVGDSSKKYFSTLARDKVAYLNLVSDLKKISKELKNEASSTETLITKINK
ncbi:hypothetical protein IKE98_00820 [Candidatus Saccharibacteria bacterium]|nr:hypothetical protein [Candidatus Saccharibacteria bacterium]